MTATVVDSGILSALFNPRDQWHERAAIFFKANSREAVVPLSILGEVTYIIEEKRGSRGPRSLAD